MNFIRRNTVRHSFYKLAFITVMAAVSFAIKTTQQPTVKTKAGLNVSLSEQRSISALPANHVAAKGVK